MASRPAHKFLIDWDDAGDFSHGKANVTEDAFEVGYESGMDAATNLEEIVFAINKGRIRLDNSDGHYDSLTAAQQTTPHKFRHVITLNGTDYVQYTGEAQIPRHNQYRAGRTLDIEIYSVWHTKFREDAIWGPSGTMADFAGLALSALDVGTSTFHPGSTLNVSGLAVEENGGQIINRILRITNSLLLPKILTNGDEGLEYYYAQSDTRTVSYRLNESTYWINKETPRRIIKWASIRNMLKTQFNTTATQNFPQNTGYGERRFAFVSLFWDNRSEATSRTWGVRLEDFPAPGDGREYIAFENYGFTVQGAEQVTTNVPPDVITRGVTLHVSSTGIDHTGPDSVFDNNIWVSGWADADRSRYLFHVTLRLYGTGVYATTTDEIDIIAQDSQDKYGIVEGQDIPLWFTDTALPTLTTFLEERGEPPDVTVLEFQYLQPSDIAVTNLFQDTIGKIVTLDIDDNTFKSSGDHIITYKRFSYRDGEIPQMRMHFLKWDHMGTPLMDWLLGTTGRSELGTTTVLG